MNTVLFVNATTVFSENFFQFFKREVLCEITEIMYTKLIILQCNVD